MRQYIELIIGFLFACVLPALSSEVETIPVFSLSDSSKAIRISKTLILEDSEKKLDFDQLIELDRSGSLEWKVNTANSLGYSLSRIWLKFEIRNASSDRSEWILEQRYSILQIFDVYFKTGSGVHSFQTGRLRAFDDRPYKHRYFIYPVTLERDKSIIVYTKLESKSPLQSVLSVYEKNHFIESASNESILIGIYLGSILAMITYNFFLFIGTKERFYILYISYAICFFLFQTFVTGIGYQFLWPKSTKWNNIAGSFLLGASYFFLSRFARYFLETNLFSKVSDLVLRAISWFSVGIMFFSVVSYSSVLSQFNAMFITVVSVLLFAISVLCFRGGSKNALYFIVAFGTFLVATAFYGLNDLGKISGNSIVLYGPLLASTFEILLLSLALASRINSLKEEKIRIQDEMMKKEHTLQKEKCLAELATQVVHDIKSPLLALNVVVRDFSGLSEHNRILIGIVIQRINEISNVLLKSYRQGISSSNEGSVLIENHGKSSSTLLSALIEEITSEKKVQYQRKDQISIEFYQTNNSFKIFTKINAIELGRALSNLIDNSIEAMEGRGNVRIILKRESEMAVIDITDNGKGIPQEVVSQLGGRGKTYGKQGGGGLGLFHAKSIVESWNGVLEVKSSLGVGTVVSIRLPLCDELQ